MKNTEITEFIFKEMRTQKVTAKEMCKRTGYTEPAISYWKTGRRTMTMACAEKMLNALGYELTIKELEVEQCEKQI